MSKTILFLAANPVNIPSLRLDHEIREIEDGLRRASIRDQFVLKQQWATRPVDIRRALLDISPQIVHFAGHGAGQNGIVLEDDAGHAKFVDPKALARLFSLFTSIECVLLNACHTEIQATALNQHIDYVIGIPHEIQDAESIEFSTSFFDALGAGRGYEFAYQYACSAVALSYEQMTQEPILLQRSGVNERSLSTVQNTHQPQMPIELEKLGDQNVHKAIWSIAPRESQQYWEKAREAYVDALSDYTSSQVQNIIGARLYRKLAECLRKLTTEAQTDRIRDEIYRGQAIVRNLPDMDIPEKAYLDLELAYCTFMDVEQDRIPATAMKYSSEEIVKEYESLSQQNDDEHQEDINCILGETYNLLGIALAMTQEVSSFGRNPDACWDRAERYLEMSGTERAIRIKSDLVINRALDLEYAGANDLAIKILANVLQEELPLSRVRLVRQNLILAYCHRNSIDDCQQAQTLLDEEFHLARQVLAMDDQDYNDLLYILQCNLYLLKAKMEHTESEEVLNTYAKEAEDTYSEWIGLSPSGSATGRDVTSEQLEFHRSMADIYILAKDQDHAQIEHEFVDRYKPVGIQSGGWKVGDLYTTCGLYYSLIKDYDHAIDELNDARRCFEYEEHKGLVVDTDIKIAEICMEQNRLDEARSVLAQARVTARRLACRTRVERVASALEKVTID